MNNLYQLLGISNQATIEEIWKAIKNAAQKQSLPLEVLQEAKRKLTVPEERQRYDTKLSAPPPKIETDQPDTDKTNDKKYPIVSDFVHKTITINYDASLWETLPLGLKKLMPQFQELNYDFQSDTEKKIYHSIMEILTNHQLDISFCRMCNYGRDRFISFNCYFPILLFCARGDTIEAYSNRTITYYKKLGISAGKPHSKYVNWRTLVSLESVEQLIAVFQNEIIFSYQRAATAFNLMSLDFSAEQEDYIAAYLSQPAAWVYYKHYRGVFKRADEFLFLSGINLKDD